MSTGEGRGRRERREGTYGKIFWQPLYAFILVGIFSVEPLGVELVV